MRYKLVALLSFVTLIGLSQSLPIIPQPQQVMLSGDSVAIGKFKGLTFRLPYLFDKYNDEAYHLVITKDTLYAEALWTKSDRKDFKDFEQRLNSFQPK